MEARRERVVEARFPTACGVYVVFDPGLYEPPLYVGVAATQTIEQRWRRQHLRSRAGGSALRRTLGVHLGLVERKLSIRTDGRFYPPEVENAISAFLLDCEVAFVVADSPEDAKTIERDLIGSLRPTLNVKRS
jgi:GIY-YIG catalytic domain-containing protein